MLVLVTGLVLILWGEPCWGGVFEFVGDIRHYAVATNSVYVATEDRLYQLSHDLRLIRSVTQRGFLVNAKKLEDERFSRVPVPGGVDAVFRVNVLLPYVENKALFTCGVTDNECGYCEVRDMINISKITHNETFQLGPPWRQSASVAFLVNVQNRPNDTFILSAVEQREEARTKSCTIGSEAVTLHNTQPGQFGGIFSPNEAHGSPVIARRNRSVSVQFVDGFQVDWNIYLFFNQSSRGKSNNVRLIWLKGSKTKSETLKSLKGAVLRVSEDDGGSKLLASSAVPGGPQVLWSGVFSVGEDQANTQLALFDVSPDLTVKTNADPVFCAPCEEIQKTDVSIAKAEDYCFD